MTRCVGNRATLPSPRLNHQSPFLFSNSHNLFSIFLFFPFSHQHHHQLVTPHHLGPSRPLLHTSTHPAEPGSLPTSGIPGCSPAPLPRAWRNTPLALMAGPLLLAGARRRRSGGLAGARAGAGTAARGGSWWPRLVLAIHPHWAGFVPPAQEHKATRTRVPRIRGGRLPSAPLRRPLLVLSGGECPS